MTTYSTDTDAVGTLLTTEWGNPPQLQPAGVPNFQGYGASGQGLEEVYPYLYNPTVDVPPLDESEGGLALQEQEWVGEVQYLQEEDPEFLEGADITEDVVFENPLDTLSAADTSLAARSAGENVVDFDREVDPGVDTPVADGVTEETTKVEEKEEVTPDIVEGAPLLKSEAIVEAKAEDEAFSAPSDGQTEATEAPEAPVVAKADPTALPDTGVTNA
jgi:hypothetical protein